MIKNRKGISLIVLIITIIVMIILASAIILSLNNSGIIGKANQAVLDINDSQLDEQLSLAYGEAYLKETDEQKTDDWYYKEITKYLKERGYGQEQIQKALAKTDFLPSIDKLQEEYEFMYYDSLTGAIADINEGKIGANANSDKLNAVAGAYVDGGKNVVVLLKNTTEPLITLDTDVTLNLGGNTLTSELFIDNTNVHITIDGRLMGSTIISNDSAFTRTIRLKAGSLNLNGGTYIAETSEASSMALVIMSAGNLDIQNVNLKAESTGENSKARNVETRPGGITSLVESELVATAKNGVAIGIYNTSTFTSVIDCNIKAYSDYNIQENILSQGICNNSGEMYIKDCNVMGTNVALALESDTVIEGGTYEGYEYGGAFFGGGRTTHYIKNANIGICEMPEGYASKGNVTKYGFVIGGNAESNNIKVYMDNCDIYSNKYWGAFADAHGETNNALYISNSRVNLDNDVSFYIWLSAGHKMYIGKGCNFTKANVNLPSVVVSTDEVYVKE